MSLKRIHRIAAAILLAGPAAKLAADATIYGSAHVSADYIDASASAAWRRPAIGIPSFDVLTFIDGTNQALSDAGYTEALRRPTPLNTLTGDLLFGTIPFDSLDPVTQGRVLDALDSAVTPGQSFKGWDLNANSRDSRIGIKGSEPLGSGLSAIYQVEMEVSLADDNGNILDGDRGALKMRNSFVGLAGAWGTLLFGRHDTPLKLSTGRLDLFDDTLADYNSTVGFADLRADNSILYASPTFWGLNLAGAVIPAGGSTLVGDLNSNADSIAAGWSLAAVYERGPFHASLAYESLESELWQPQDGAYDIVHGVFASDETKWRIGLGLLDWHGFTLTGIYESRTDILGMPVDASSESWQLQTGYAFGNNMIKAMYGVADLEPCADPWAVGFRFTCSSGKLGEVLGDELQIELDQQDKRAWALGFDHNFSKRTKLYVLYTAVSDDNPDADWSGFSLGMAHRF